MRHKRAQGFTLLEILIAMFVFSILSLMLVSALRRVIDADATTARHATQLRELQMALIIVSRDIEQTVARNIVTATGNDEGFVGTPKALRFTHTGFANPDASAAHSSLSRTEYVYTNHALWRVTWPELDQTPDAKPHRRLLLDHVQRASFAYLDRKQHFHAHWPARNSDITDPLPIAVALSLEIEHWGTLKQLYVIPVSLVGAANATQ